MEDGRIPDSAISASSFYSEGTHSNDPQPWVQVDLGKDAMIKKIAT